MQKVTTCILILATAFCGGCKSTGLLAKREAEKCCPTDIRKTVPWCAGEDALFKCPCEPSTAFYGYKPTCWRTWPTNGSTWRDMHCGNQHHEAIINTLTQQNPELIELPTLKSLPTPADQPGADDAAGDEKQQTAKPMPIQVPSVKLDLEPAPEPPAVPRLKEDLEPNRAPAAKDDRVLPKKQSVEVEAEAEDLPSPVLGPIPLPPIDEEYPE